MIFNISNQVSLTEDKKYLLTFPHNLTTPRFRYTEELDLIGLTSADVVMASSNVSFRVYGESHDRVYTALPPSSGYNTGARVCVLTRPSVVGTGAQFIVNVDTGAIDSVTVISGGSGYDAVPNLVFVDDGGNGSGSGATANCTVVNGTITSVTILTEGSNYSNNVTIKLK
jgi:hypothetical protein